MEPRRLARSRPPTALLLLAALAAALVTAGAAPPRATGAVDTALVVAVSADSPMRDISHSVLRRAFLGEVTEHQGVRLIPLNQPPGTPARVNFDRRVLGLEPDAIARFWIDQRIRGQGAAPRSIPTAPLLLRVLAKLPGGISYVRAADIPPGAGVRVLTIDGKSLGQPGYLLP